MGDAEQGRDKQTGFCTAPAPLISSKNGVGEDYVIVTTITVMIRVQKNTPKRMRQPVRGYLPLGLDLILPATGAPFDGAAHLSKTYEVTDRPRT